MSLKSIHVLICDVCGTEVRGADSAPPHVEVSLWAKAHRAGGSHTDDPAGHYSATVCSRVCAEQAVIGALCEVLNTATRKADG